MNTTPAAFDATPRFFPSSAAAPSRAGDHLFRVDVQVIGLALKHRWTGWADTPEIATQRGLADARQLFRGYSLCVFSVVQVGV